jgi:hypothetical protein
VERQPPYEACVRLIAYAGIYWEAFDGELATRGIDPLALAFNRFLNAVYAWVLAEVRGRGLETLSLTEGIERLNAELLKPLPGSRREPSRAVIEDEMRQFQQAAATAATARGR